MNHKFLKNQTRSLFNLSRFGKVGFLVALAVVVGLLTWGEKVYSQTPRTLTVSSYGACGQNDSAAAVQNALNDAVSGDTVVVDCFVNIGAAGLKLENKSNITVTATGGGGFKATARTGQSGQLDAKGPILFKLYNCDSCVVQDLVIDGNNVGVSGVMIEGSDNAIIQRLNVSNVTIPAMCGICGSGNRNNQYLYNVVHDTGQAGGDGTRGIWLGNPSSQAVEWYPIVTNNHTYMTGHTGIASHPVAAVFRNNTCETTKPGIGAAGIKIVPGASSGTTYVENNILRNNNGNGLQLENATADSIIVKNNSISGNSDSGILMNGTNNTNITVTDNTFTSNYKNINAIDVRGLTLERNTMNGGFTIFQGLSGRTISNVTIASNLMQNPTSDAIQVIIDQGSNASINTVTIRGNSFRGGNSALYIEDKAGQGRITNVSLNTDNCFTSLSSIVRDFRNLLLSSNYSQSGSCSDPTSGGTTTPPPSGGDTTVPNMSAVFSSSITSNSATINWTTNEGSDSLVEYGTSVSYGQSTTLNTSMVTTHTVSLSGLTPNTTYHYRVKSKDAAGNLAVSLDYLFTTAVAPATGDTVVPHMLWVASSNITSNSATIDWVTDEVSDSTVEYGLTSGYGQSTPLNTSMVTNHSVALSGLTPNTTYHYRVKSKDAAGNQSISLDYTFVTPNGPAAPADTTVPNMLWVASSNITSSGATIDWVTNEASDSLVEYGTSVSYGQSTTLNTSMVTTHTVSLSGLTPNTTYHYRVKSKDAVGNQAVSLNYTFTTAAGPAVPADTTVPNMNGVYTSGVTSLAAIVNWTTDEASDSLVEYGTSASYGQSTTLNTSMVTTHSVNLSGLTPNTTYHYRVKSKDAVGNQAVSLDYLFTTASAGTCPTSVPSESFTGCYYSGKDFNTFALSRSEAAVNFNWGSGSPDASLPADSFSVRWQGDFSFTAGDYDFVTLSADGIRVYVDNSLVIDNWTNHAAAINAGATTLTAGTHRVKVEYFENSGDAAIQVAWTKKVVIPEVTDTIAPTISAINASSLTTNNAVITWNTDEGGDTQVEYGVTTSYGQSSSLNSTFALAHTVALSGLSPATTYQYRVKSKDTSGNQSISSNLTFTTLPLATPDTTPPAAISNLSASEITQTSAKLSFSAPGNNGTTGTALSYTLRYSTTPITESNFHSSIPASGLPSPLAAGSTQTYTLVGLSANTAYYVAIKASDSAGNVSGISNLATFNTLQNTTQNQNNNNNNNTNTSGGSGNQSFPVITNLSAASLNSQVSLSWAVPQDSRFVRTLIVRKEGSMPTSPNNGTKVYEGSATSFVDTNLTNNRQYYYRAYAIFISGADESSQISVSASPSVGKSQISTSAKPSGSGAGSSGSSAAVGSLGAASSAVSSAASAKLIPLTSPLGRGVRSVDQVISLQTALHLKGYLTADSVTGYFGPLTEAAVKKYQCEKGIACSGTPQTTGYGNVGPSTRKLLNIEIESLKSAGSGSIIGALPALSGTAAASAGATSASGSASPLTVALGRGSKNTSQVTSLQTTLYLKGYLAADSVTGYFGPLTEAAVKKYQCEKGIACSGTPQTTGYGNVGPSTRKALNADMQSLKVIPN